MGIFKTSPQATDNTPELTQEIAMTIYELLKSQTPKEVFENSEGSTIDWTHVDKVYKSAMKLFDDITSAVHKKIITSEAVYSESGELLSSEVLGYQFESFDAIWTMYGVEWLDKDTVIADVTEGKTLAELREE